jgi:threonine/homoserine/homoserine lactone efflux protein
VSAAELGSLLLLCTAMTFSPGPNTTLSTTLGANHGLRRAWRFCLAVATGWALLLVACCLGLGAVISVVPTLRWAVTAAGVAYLLLLAYRLAFRTAAARSGSDAPDVGFLAGVGLQLVNIKAWMLTLTLTAGWITAVAAPTAGRVVTVGAVLVVFALASNLTYAVVGSVLAGWLARGTRMLWFNRFLAAVLVSTAARMLAGAAGR